MTSLSRPVGDRAQNLEAFAQRHRLRALEVVPWVGAGIAYLVFPGYLALAAQILATIIFALSVDLLVGYVGIVTLGHAAFFGAGAYAAGLLAATGWAEQLTGLLTGASGAGVRLISGAIILRTGLARSQTWWRQCSMSLTSGHVPAPTMQGMQVWLWRLCSTCWVDRLLLLP
jgi:branched-chain amino acid transport system permease protein